MRRSLRRWSYFGIVPHERLAKGEKFMYKKLCEIMTSQVFAALYSNFNDTTSFVYGKIIAVNEHHLLIYMISPDGNFDGFLMKKVEDIFRIETGGQYFQKMSRLISEDATAHISDIALRADDIPSSLLTASKAMQQVVAIEQMDSGINDVIGIVRDISDSCVAVSQIDEYGSADGISYIRASDISQISYMSQDEQRIWRLWNSIQSGR